MEPKWGRKHRKRILNQLKEKRIKRKGKERKTPKTNYQQDELLHWRSKQEEGEKNMKEKQQLRRRNKK